MFDIENAKNPKLTILIFKCQLPIVETSRLKILKEKEMQRQFGLALPIVNQQRVLYLNIY